MSVTASRSAGVPQNYDMSFTVQLSHSIQSTSHAYRVLLEIAVPHDHLTNARTVESPAKGAISLVDGNQAPSANSRYCYILY